jgi:hypothetical protein
MVVERAMTSSKVAVLLVLSLASCTIDMRRRVAGGTGGAAGGEGGEGGESGGGGGGGAAGMGGRGGASGSGGSGGGSGGSGGAGGGAPDAGPLDGPADLVGVDLALPAPDAASDASVEAPVAKRVLLVTGATLTMPDIQMRDRLMQRGIPVDMALDSAAATAANGKGLVVITSSGARAMLMGKYTAVPVPIIVMKSQVPASMNMSTADGESPVMQSPNLAIAAAADPLAAGLTGTVMVYNVANRMVWGMPSNAATVVATVVGQANQAAIYAYEANEMMVGNMRAPAKRMGFFCHQEGVLSANGLRLFEAAVDWALR